jgi:small subunit ribosomal protein S7
MKLYNLWDVSEVKVEDPSLKKVINLDARLNLKSYGRIKFDAAKTKVSVVERLVNVVQIPGTRGKKHKIITGWMTGKHAKATKIVIDTFKIIENRTGRNPIAVFVKAIENAAPREEVTSPRRRLNLALRYFVHGAYDKAFNKKATIVQALANEIIMASEGSSESFAVSKKNDAEKQADAAR